MADEAVLGKVAKVTHRIRGGQQPGEITTVVRGAHETFIAYAETPLEVGADVLVTTIRGPRSVDVIAWT